MSTRYESNLAVLAKIETTEGTDAVPTGAANAVQMVNVKLTLDGQRIERGLLKPYMGHQGIILAGLFQRLSGEVEIVGAGEAGKKPPFGQLLRMAGMAETVTADTDVTYNPISRNFESGSIYYNLDGVRHVLLGTRGSWKLSMRPQEIARFSFDLVGLLGTITDAALPTADYSGFIDPVPVGEANTTFSLHGYAGATESISIDIGGDVQPRMLINKQRIQYTARKATGEAVMEATSLAEINWVNKARNHAIGVMAVQHGTVSGNIFEVNADRTQLDLPEYGGSQGIVNNTLKTIFKPSDAGNDEVILTFR